MNFVFADRYMCKIPWTIVGCISCVDRVYKNISTAFPKSNVTEAANSDWPILAITVNAMHNLFGARKDFLRKPRCCVNNLKSKKRTSYALDQMGKLAKVDSLIKPPFSTKHLCRRTFVCWYTESVDVNTYLTSFALRSTLCDVQQKKQARLLYCQVIRNLRAIKGVYKRWTKVDYDTYDGSDTNYNQLLTYKVYNV